MSKRNVNLVTDIAGKNEKFFPKEIKPRGLATPKLLVGLYGFFDANIWRDICIDDETGGIKSKYTARQMANYKSYCERMAGVLGNYLAPARIKAEQLIKEDMRLCDEIKQCTCSDGATAREREATGKKLNSLYQNHTEILSQLIELEKSKKTCEYTLKKELEAVAEEFKTRFASYSHGMRLKAVSVEQFPEMSYSNVLDDYKQTYGNDDVMLTNYIKEGKKYV